MASNDSSENIDTTTSPMAFYCMMQSLADANKNMQERSISNKIDLHEHCIKNIHFISRALDELARGKLSDKQKEALKEHIENFNNKDFPMLVDQGILTIHDNPIPQDFDIMNAGEEEIFEITLNIDELAEKEQRVLKKSADDLYKNSNDHHVSTLTITMGANKKSEVDDFIRGQRSQ